MHYIHTCSQNFGKIRKRICGEGANSILDQPCFGQKHYILTVVQFIWIFLVRHLRFQILKQHHQEKPMVISEENLTVKINFA